jgi:DNA-binding CsgD family transcriptional regulator
MKSSKASQLTPAQKRVLDVLLNKESTAETSAEIARELGYSRDTVDHMLSAVYAFYGVKGARGLFRRLDRIATELRPPAHNGVTHDSKGSRTA